MAQSSAASQSRHPTSTPRSRPTAAAATLGEKKLECILSAWRQKDLTLKFIESLLNQKSTTPMKIILHAIVKIYVSEKFLRPYL